MNRDEFLHQIQNLTGLGKEEAEYGTLIVLSTISHRIQPEEAMDAASQLPKGIKELWMGDTWDTFVSHVIDLDMDYKTKEDFYNSISQQITDYGISANPIDLTKAVLMTLKDQISEGEARHIEANLPKEIKEVWESS